MTDQVTATTPPTMGTLIKWYYGNKGSQKSTLQGLGGLAVGILIAAVFFGSSDPQEATFVFIGTILLVVPIFGGIIGYQWWKNRDLSVQLYTDGLVRVHGRKTESLRWDEIQAVWQKITKHYQNGVYAGMTYRYTVKTLDKRTLTFDSNLIGIAELGEKIQLEATNRIFPRIIANYDDGQTIRFGAFTVNKKGIGYQNQSLPWAEIEGAQINNGYISFKKQDKWFSWVKVPVSEIPNLLIFLSLIDHVVGLKAGR